MFLRFSKDISFYAKRSEWLKYLDEYNLDKKTKLGISKISRKINDYSFIYFKYWIFFRWVRKNFKLSESFFYKFYRNSKKLEIQLSSKEEDFIQNAEEIYFTAWRPLKEYPVKFDLDKKEVINFMQSNVNIHYFYPERYKEKIKFFTKCSLFFSSINIYVCDEDQNIMCKFKIKDIEEVSPIKIGVQIKISGTIYLFRGYNILLIYAILQRMAPNLNLDIKNIEDLYSYFDSVGKLLSRFN